MVERVATMLNYFLRHLAGKCSRGEGRLKEQQVCCLQAVEALGQGEAAGLHYRHQLGCRWSAILHHILRHQTGTQVLGLCGPVLASAFPDGAAALHNLTLNHLAAPWQHPLSTLSAPCPDLSAPSPAISCKSCSAGLRWCQTSAASFLPRQAGSGCSARLQRSRAKLKHAALHCCLQSPSACSTG